MLRRIRGDSPAQWALATRPRVPESLMIDDENVHHVPHKDTPESQDDEFARAVRIRDAAKRSFLHVGTDCEWPQLRLKPRSGNSGIASGSRTLLH